MSDVNILDNVTINDGAGDPINLLIGSAAERVTFDNTDTGLTGTELQTAIQQVLGQNSYGVCSSTGSAGIKVVSIDNFILRPGAKAVIKFENDNTAENPTLNISNTGAKAITVNSQAVGTDVIKAGYVFLVNYNGTAYDIVGGVGGGAEDYFLGTTAEWDALLPAEKAKYDEKLVFITDDASGGGGGNTKSVKAMYDASPALYAHAVDDLVLFNDILYKVTSAISVGDSLVVGTNIIASDLDEDTVIYIDKMPGGGGGGGKQDSDIRVDATATVTTANRSVTKSVAIVAGDGTLSIINSDDTVCTATLSGNNITITGIKPGNATITVAISATENYNGATAEIAVTSTAIKIVTWTSGSDAEVKAMIDAYYADEMSLAEIQEVWSVGNKRSVSLSAMTATGVGESHRAQTVQMTILGFEHDTLTTSINGHTKALITVEQEACLMAEGIDDTNGSSNSEHGYMNSTNTNVGGWKDSARRTWCNNVYYNALPSGFKAMVKQVNKVSSQGNKLTTLDTTSDYIFLPSEIEIFGSVTRSVAGEGSQYAYYAAATSNRYKSPHWSSSNVSDDWWDRSPAVSGTTSFCTVNGSGGDYSHNASGAYGLAPACAL